MKTKLHWRVNNQIRAPKVRLVGSDGKQVGVLDRKEALSKAKDEGLDLVEVAPKAKPPVVKIVDIGKFKYRQEKKERKQKKKAKSTEVKEVRFSPFIGEHDFKTRLERAEEFLKEGHKVKAVVKFKGRQMGSKQYGYKVTDKILDSVGRDKISLDMEPKFVGRHLTMVISPTTKGKKPKAKPSKSN